MSSLYPAQIDTTISIPSVIDGKTPISASTINILRDTLLIVQTELGPKPSGTYTTVRSRLDAFDSLIQLIDSGGINPNFGSQNITTTGIFVGNFIDSTAPGITLNLGTTNANLINAGAKFNFTKGFRVNVANVAGNYSVLVTDYLLSIRTLSGKYTVTLPSAASSTIGDTYHIKDSDGNASVNIITISGNGSLIDGVSNYIVNYNWSVITLTYVRANTWSVI